MKAQREKEFKEFEQEHSGDSNVFQKEIEEEAVKSLEQIELSFSKNKDSVVTKLLERVVQVKPSLHQNYKK